MSHPICLSRNYSATFYKQRTRAHADFRDNYFATPILKGVNPVGLL